MEGIASITANGVIKLQGGGQIQHAENKRVERAVDDEASEVPNSREFGKEEPATLQR
jgi:hypothetical protein